MVRVRGRRPRRFAALIVVLAIVVIVAGSAASLIRIGTDAVDDLEGAIRDAVPTAVPPAPVGVQSGSLLRPAELKAALAKLPAGEIELLRVAPERIDAQVVVDGQMHIVQVRSDGGVSNVTTPATGRGEAVKVNSAAPVADRPDRRATGRPRPRDRLLPRAVTLRGLDRVAAVLRRRTALLGERERQEGAPRRLTVAA